MDRMQGNLEKFENLPEERQEAVVRAAVEAFGRFDYKSASTEDIARKAGISKGLLFFYFKNKQQLYLYLTNRLMDKVEALVVDEGFYRIDDFFELFKYAAHSKRAALDKFPYLMEFSVRAFYAQHRDIKQLMESWTQRQIDAMFARYFRNVDFSRFRDDVDPKHVVNMIVWMADGYMHQQLALGRRIDLDELLDEFDRWCVMFKAYAYKEEYR
ncbi:TetR/AcrR family transcriptional regulator [Arabiibacter massiliensis]|uniref:TetR/AcrR family transcriptional regulator n=1 Tax=Arabiibacter massiliensis TaxID=1870985 RepID=UPI001E359041|nr:TetR/AcrR family transcriptional regulator [Arabiibacter massiliensis]